jgi:hypothetical protein
LCKIVNQIVEYPGEEEEEEEEKAIGPTPLAAAYAIYLATDCVTVFDKTYTSGRQAAA